MRGKFITLEGGEAAGKSTQAGLLALKLEDAGLVVLQTREPGGSPGAEIIRHVLLSGVAKPLGADAEAMLFAAAREDHVHCTIEPALAAGKWVVCDRFVDSTRVYQGVLGSVDPQLIRGLERISIGELMPDLTLILDAPVDVTTERMALRRGNAAADRFEGEGLEFHTKLRDAFLTLARLEPERCVVIDSNAPREHVAKQIWDAVQSRLKPEAVRSAHQEDVLKVS
jgi:dTMP kinase